MKKIYVLLTLGSLLFSCNSDSDDEKNTASLVGDWKISKAEVISGSNNSTVLYSETLTGCDANTSFEFKNDGKYALKYFYEQNG
jgi:predicted small secreted protein